MAADPRHTTVTATERDTDPAENIPVAAYFMDHPSLSGRFVLGSGLKSTEATAFVVVDSGDRVVLDDDPDAEDRKLYLLNNSRVVL